MIKEIGLSNGSTVKYNSKTNSGFEEILSFYEPKINTMVYNWRNTPHGYDREDLIQICRIKLLEALRQYDMSLNINFSTYVYTIWQRKISQTFSKYKGKKYSAYIENDKHVNPNHCLDREHSAYYLQLKKDKCPISTDVIDKKSCLKCEHHVKYASREITKGKHQGETKNFTLCKHCSEILEMRGIKSVSLQSPVNNSGTCLLNIIPCNKQIKTQKENDLKMDLNKLEKTISKKSFKVLNFLYSGMNKNEIMKKMKLDRTGLNQIVVSLSRNKKLKEILIEK